MQIDKIKNVFQKNKASAPSGREDMQNIQAAGSDADMSAYADKDFDELQLLQIRLGIKSGLAVSVYDSPKYSWQQMNQIRLGLEAGLNVAVYADPAYSEEQMKKLRFRLEEAELEKDAPGDAPKEEKRDAEETAGEEETEKEEKPSFAERYYDKADREHADILSKLALINRSDESGRFTKHDRLDAIRDTLKDSGYKEIYTQYASIWVKDVPKITTDNGLYLVSSHADVVNSIRTPYSKLDNNGYYKGTYDNLATNAAMTIAMLEGKLPDNVIFAFTADEETGRCRGAKNALNILKNSLKTHSGEMKDTDITCIALDVTYEGYDEGLLASVENCTKNADFLDKVTDAALNSQEDEQTFCFVRKNKKAVSEKLPKEYVTKSMGMMDEAFIYDEMKVNTFSLCVPTEGNMHGDSGLDMRQPVFEGYVNMLEMMLYSMTKTHPELIEAKKIENREFLSRSKQLVKEEETTRKNVRDIYNSYASCGQDYSYYNKPVFPDSSFANDFYGYSGIGGNYEEDLSAYYGFDTDNLQMVVEENIDCWDNLEDPKLKKEFIREVINATYPEVYEQVKTLEGMVKNIVEAFLEMRDGLDEDRDDEALGYDDDDDDYYFGYADELE